MLVDVCTGITSEVQTFRNGGVDICDVCCIGILLRFGSDVRQRNLFRVTFIIRYSQYHVAIAVRFIFTLASCCRICYQTIVSLGHLGKYIAQINIDFACIVPFQCQSLAVSGNAAACNKVIFETCHISS